MTTDHAGRVGWAGYLRKPVCVCGWEGRRQKEAARAEADLARHLEASGVGGR